MRRKYRPKLPGVLDWKEERRVSESGVVLVVAAEVGDLVQE